MNAPRPAPPEPPARVARFAPSPTGLLHAGSLVAALASWLDARAQGAQWLVRIEDVDTPRCLPGAAEGILRQLAQCGLRPDGPPVVQSERSALYLSALTTLAQHGLVYPCTCSRKDIAQALSARGLQRERHAAAVYPGTCRPASALALEGPIELRPGVAWRFRTEPGPPLGWVDRRLGEQQQDVAAEVGDFVLWRADGLWAYQLAVVVDDADQGVTHIVRGADLADNTARQITLQRALGLPTPSYLHTPLVLGANGEKLSKQNGAEPVVTGTPEAAWQALCMAAAALGLPAVNGTTLADAAPGWVSAWQARWP